MQLEGSHLRRALNGPEWPRIVTSRAKRGRYRRWDPQRIEGVVTKTRDSTGRDGISRPVPSRPVPTKSRDEGGFNSSAHTRLLRAPGTNTARLLRSFGTYCMRLQTGQHGGWCSFHKASHFYPRGNRNTAKSAS